ncbi:MAG: 4Fe-4S cluster-binding domain-containing protein [bacterium]|nr:4Fe-4S cluster-binding domain-containing protein [bacterium]
MSCIKETYMEYSIMTTNRCNLQCVYCINSDRRRQTNLKADASKIISYITKDVTQHSYDPVVVTFYGGEPLLEQGFLTEIMSGLGHLHPLYNIFTNGTLINTKNIPLLEKMNMISISIDGVAQQHDATRGKGTHRQILNNYLSVENQIRDKVLAFITITPTSSVYDSVMGLVDKFNNIFWFLENSDNQNNLPGFLERYDSDLDRLMDWWRSQLRTGKVPHLIPFQGLYDILEKKHIYSGLPCGIGENFQALAIDGSIYTCEDSYHNRIGDIKSGADMAKSQHHYDFEICRDCEIKTICAGRCVVPHLNFSREKVEFYCQCSKLLIYKFKKILQEIKELIAQGTISEAAVLNRLTRFTDVIP